MQTIEGIRETVSSESGFVVDTTFVLFFLALEFGRSLASFGIDSVLLGNSLIMLAIVPYFLVNASIGRDFGKWLAGRSVITVFATLLGVVFDQTICLVLPDVMRYIPMALLIVSAMTSCYFQFYSLLRLRPAK
jgi:glucan phosphoethanolaminetransferase (alkaline phosphatase superfamily)